MKFVAATHIENFYLAANLGLRCVVYIGCVAILYALAMFAVILTFDLTIALYDSHGTAMIKLLKCFD